MKKFAIALSMAAMSIGILPFGINAQTTANGQSATTEQAPQKRECLSKDGLCMKKDGVNLDKKCKVDKADKCKIDGRKQKCKGKDGKRGDMKSGKERKGKMNPMAGIELNDAQKAKLEKLRAEQKQERSKLKAEAREKSEKLRTEFDKDLMKILTPEQLKQYEANKARISEMKASKKSNGDRAKIDRKGHKGGKHHQGQRRDREARGERAAS